MLGLLMPSCLFNTRKGPEARTMYIQDTAERLPPEAIQELRTAITTAKAALKKGDFRQACDTLIPFRPAYNRPAGKDPEWNRAHARGWLTDLEKRLACPDVAGREIFAGWGALLDVLDFLAEQQAERERADDS